MLNQSNAQNSVGVKIISERSAGTVCKAQALTHIKICVGACNFVVGLKDSQGGVVIFATLV
jgi:hypothetical protein